MPPIFVTSYAEGTAKYSSCLWQTLQDEKILMFALSISTLPVLFIRLFLNGLVVSINLVSIRRKKKIRFLFPTGKHKSCGRK